MIEAEHLTKQYGTHTAVSDLNFMIRDNGVYGFLGPNGAGKSTTMNMITGCLAPSGGHVRIFGHDIQEEPEEAKKQIGYLPEIPPLYMDMTPSEYLRFVAGVKKIPAGEIPGEVQKAMEAVSIVHMKDRLIQNLSKGYKQRVGIAQALLGSPGIIILDEPSVGLDPRQITEVRELVRSLGQDHIVLFSSHIMQEVQAISDRVMIIAKGKLITEGRPDELEQRLRKKPVVTLRARSEQDRAQKLLERIEEIEKIEFIHEEGGICTFRVTTEDHDTAAEKAFFAFAEEGLPILSMEHEAITLEGAFLQLTAAAEAPQEEAVQESGAPQEENDI